VVPILGQFMSIRNRILAAAFVLVCSSAWCNVFVHWTSSTVPPVAELGMNNLVLSWNEDISAQVKAARKQGYQVYVEVPLDQAAGVAETPSALRPAWSLPQVSIRPRLSGSSSGMRPRMAKRSGYRRAASIDGIPK